MCIYHDLSDLPCDIRSASYRAIAQEQPGEYPGAPETLETALRIYRGPADQEGEAGALSYLAGMQWRTGDYQAAIETPWSA